MKMTITQAKKYKAAHTRKLNPSMKYIWLEIDGCIMQSHNCGIKKWEAIMVDLVDYKRSKWDRIMMTKAEYAMFLLKWKD